MISAPFIRKPIATSLLFAAILLIGIVAYPMLPVAPLPQTDFPTIQVNAQLPGASPETMAATVAAPLERQFSLISGVAQVTSTSAQGSTSITVQFDLNRNIDAAAQDIQAAINAAGGQLPKNLPSPPNYRKVNPADAPILLLSVTSEVQPLTRVDDYADTVLAQQISQISGVGQVSIGGEQKTSVRVQIDPTKIASMGLSLEDVRATLVNATVNAPKGLIDGDRQSFTIYDNDQLLKAEPYNDLIVAYRNGAPVRIGDIGRAIEAPEDMRQAGWANGKRAVLLVIFKQPGANVIDTVDAVKAALPRLQLAIPPSVHVDLLADRTTTIRASVEDVQFTLVLTIALVVGVIFLFLRNAWATIIPSVTVPLALLGTAALMYVVGYSLDNLSLMALTIAVGFVVDDAIVMLENIYRHVEEGMSPMEAAYKGAGEIGFTILSISISLVAVFIPLLLMGGVVGRLFREFAVTVTMTIAVSAFTSLTLTPMLCSRFLRHHGEQHGRFYVAVERFFDGLLNFYRRTLDRALHHQRLMLGVFFATMAFTALLFVVIPKGFFPQQDTGQLYATTTTAQDTSFADMRRRQEMVMQVIQQDPGVLSIGSMIGGNGNPLNQGRLFIALKPQSERDANADQIINRLRPKLNQFEGISTVVQSRQDINVGGRLSKAQFQYTLQDADLEELATWAPKLLGEMRALRELQDVSTDQQDGAATATLTIDRDQAARFGIQPQVIDDTLYDAFGQRQVTQYFTQANSYHVVLEVLPDVRDKLSALDKLYVKSPTTGQQVPLRALVRVDTKPTASLAVNHQGQFPAVTLSFNLSPGVSLGQATDAIQAMERRIGLPSSVTTAFQGSAQAFKASLSSQPALVAAALVAVYIILGMLYESYIHPLTILSTLPSAGVGALLALMAMGNDLSVIGIIGILLLIGIVKKNGIMMVDFAIVAERDHGKEPLEAIREACLLRFRPILMTTMAALLGGLPLMLGTGTGSELRQPLGTAMVGGLALSQLLTLYTTPVVYLYLDRVNTWLKRRRRRDEAPPLLQAAE